MANKKISELDVRSSLTLADLLVVGDPTNGYAYKITVNDLKTVTGAGVISFNGRVGAVVPAEGDYSLNQLSDVIITSAASGQLVRYNGSNWVNWTPNFLTAESDTLQSVTDRGATTTNAVTIGNNPSATQLTVNGAITTKGIFTSEPLSFNGTYKYIYANDLLLTTNNNLGYIGRTIFEFNMQTPVADSGTGAMDLVKINMPVNTGTSVANSRALVIDFTVTSNAGVLTAIDAVTGKIRLRDLAGTGNRMVVTDANGVLAAQAIPTGTVSSVGVSVGTSGTDIAVSGSPVTSSGTITINIPTASATNRGALSSADWIIFNSKQAAITLTTTGSSGAATFISNTLNIPNYTLSGLGGVPTSRKLTINGTELDLSADRSWSVGTVTSVAAITIGTTGTDITSTVATGTTTPVITLNIPTASATNRGALSSSDWTTFNNKQNALTNPVTGTGTNNYIPKFTATGSTIGNSILRESGNVIGVNTAPFGWLSTWVSIADFNNGFLAGPNDANFIIGANCYYDGSWKYKTTARATRIEMNEGTGINFYTAASGTANTAITFNNPIQIGDTGAITFNNALSGTSATFSGNVSAARFTVTGSTVPTNGMYLPSANTVAFAANSTRVIQISDSGRVSIGATTPTADTLTVHGAITTTNGGKITAQGMIEAGSTIFGGLNCIIVSDLSAASITPTGSTAPLTGMYTASSGELSFSTGTQKRFSIASGGSASFSSSVTATGLTVTGTNHDFYVGSTFANTLNFGFNTNTNLGGWVNYTGFQGGTTQFRDFNIGNGKNGVVAFFQGSTGNVGIGVNSTVGKLDIATGGNTNIVISNDSTDTGYNIVSLNGTRTKGSYAGIAGGGTGDNNLYLNSGSSVVVQTGGSFTPRMTITSGGAVQAVNNLTANSPAGGNTGEGIIAGRSFKLDASGSGQRAAMYVVSNTLSDTYGSGLQIQFANLADTLGFGFNLTTGGAYETYMKSGGSWNRAMTITSGGNVLIGRTDAANFPASTTTGFSFQGSVAAFSSANTDTLALQRVGTDGAIATFWRGTTNVGNISVTGSATAYNTSSDYRLKHDYKDYSGLDIVSKIKSYDFAWKSDNKRMYGVIAHELQEILGYAVVGEKDGIDMQGVDYSKLTPILVKAIQEQQAQIEELKSKLA